MWQQIPILKTDSWVKEESSNNLDMWEKFLFLYSHSYYHYHRTDLPQRSSSDQYMVLLQLSFVNNLRCGVWWWHHDLCCNWIFTCTGSSVWAGNVCRRFDNEKSKNWRWSIFWFHTRSYGRSVCFPGQTQKMAQKGSMEIREVVCLNYDYEKQ